MCMRIYVYTHTYIYTYTHTHTDGAVNGNKNYKKINLKIINWEVLNTWYEDQIIRWSDSVYWQKYNIKQTISGINHPHVMKVLGQISLEQMLVPRHVITPVIPLFLWIIFRMKSTFNKPSSFPQFRTVKFWPVLFNGLLDKFLFLSVIL